MLLLVVVLLLLLLLLSFTSDCAHGHFIVVHSTFVLLLSVAAFYRFWLVFWTTTRTEHWVGLTVSGNSTRPDSTRPKVVSALFSHVGCVLLLMAVVVLNYIQRFWRTHRIRNNMVFGCPYMPIVVDIPRFELLTLLPFILSLFCIIVLRNQANLKWHTF